MRFYILGIFFLFFLNSAIGQVNDSTARYKDTVYIYKDPLIITKRVFVEKPIEESPRWYVDLVIEGGFFRNQFYSKNGKNVSDDLKKTLTPRFTFMGGLSLFRQFENWDFGIGAQFRSYKEQFKNTDIVIERDSIQYQRRDTIDVYYNIIERDTNYFWIIQDNLYTDYKTNIFYQYFSEKNTSVFLEIPLTFKYKLLKEKLSVKVLGGITSAFLVATKGKIILREFFAPEVRNLQNTDFRFFSMRTNLGLELAYPLFSHFRISLSPGLSTQLTRLTSDSLPFNWRRSSISLQGGIQFEF